MTAIKCWHGGPQCPSWQVPYISTSTSGKVWAYVCTFTLVLQAQIRTVNIPVHCTHLIPKWIKKITAKSGPPYQFFFVLIQNICGNSTVVHSTVCAKCLTKDGRINEVINNMQMSQNGCCSSKNMLQNWQAPEIRKKLMALKTVTALLQTWWLIYWLHMTDVSEMWPFECIN